MKMSEFTLFVESILPRNWEITEVSITRSRGNVSMTVESLEAYFNIAMPLRELETRCDSKASLLKIIRGEIAAALGNAMCNPLPPKTDSPND